MYQSATISEVAAAHGISDAKVRSLLIEARVEIRPPYAKVPGRARPRPRPAREREEKVAARLALARQVSQEYDDGATIRALAETYEVSKATIGKLLHEGGATIRPQGNPPGGRRPPTTAEEAARHALALDLVKRRKAGTPVLELVRKQGLPYGTVQRLLAEGRALLDARSSRPRNDR
ncbi:hypothetical protein [Streptomyces sp. NPDC007346]|uniref:helix-turn-helix domain-containing protein n=1 Tax=Streptomyces sp. NPDC007346 TaxID=3154682 RepID=UPI003452FD43